MSVGRRRLGPASRLLIWTLPSPDAWRTGFAEPPRLLSRCRLSRTTRQKPRLGGARGPPGSFSALNSGRTAVRMKRERSRPCSRSTRDGQSGAPWVTPRPATAVVQLRLAPSYRILILGRHQAVESAVRRALFTMPAIGQFPMTKSPVNLIVLQPERRLNTSSPKPQTPRPEPTESSTGISELSIHAAFYLKRCIKRFGELASLRAGNFRKRCLSTRKGQPMISGIFDQFRCYQRLTKFFPAF